MRFSLRSVLVEYDGPQLIQVEDEISGTYLGVLVDEQAFRFYIAGVSKDSLRRFRTGETDLRKLLEYPPKGTTYLGTIDGESVIADPPSRILPEYLPDTGFLLRPYIDADVVVRRAQESNRLVLDVSLEPPEASTGHRIHAGSLSVLLMRIQNLVKHAYTRVLQQSSESTKSLIDASNTSILDVVAHAPESFKVTFESNQEPGWFGYSEVDRALEIIDRLLLDISNPRRSMQQISEYKGHLAGAYQKLLEFVDEYDTTVSYAWARPQSTEAHVRSISKLEASTMIAAMRGVSQLTTATVEFEGILKDIINTRNQWTLELSHGRYIRGKVEDEQILSHQESDVVYRATCEERLEMTEWGKETKVYILRHLEKVSSSDGPVAKRSVRNPEMLEQPQGRKIVFDDEDDAP